MLSIANRNTIDSKRGGLASFNKTLCSYYFNGTNARIDFGDSFGSIIEGVSKSWSVRIVYKLNVLGNNDWIFSNWNGTGSNRSMVITNSLSNNIQIFFSSTGTGTSGTWTSTSAYSDLNFHDLIVTYAAGTVVVYLDGVAIAGTSSTIPSTLYAATGDVTLGDGNNHAIFSKIYVNQLALASSVLTAQNATDLYNGSSERITSDVVTVANEYIFDNDTWNGSYWTVLDNVGAVNGVSAGMIAVDHDCNENPY